MIYYSDFSGGSLPTDPDFASTVLLLGFNGANGSTTFIDESFAAHGGATVVDGAQVSTSSPKFGSGSLRLDGTLDRIYYADSADWHFGSGDFTVEGWFSFDAANIETAQVLVSHWATGGGGQRSWSLQYAGNQATNQLQFLADSDGTGADFSITEDWTPTADTWYHIAVDRSSNAWRLYIDGVMVDSTTSSITLHNSPTNLRIGNIDSGSVEASYMRGNIDELRITKGVARYASDGGYTVPTAAFPRS